MFPDSNKIKNHIMELIQNSNSRMTPSAIGKQLRSKIPRVSKKCLNDSLQKLILNGDLTYTYEFGTSFIEASFDQPVRVSDHVVIKPERTSFSATNNDIVITLQKGASFGSGRHPSTRLALRAMEKVLFSNPSINSQNLNALDIGTGSGILAIAAILMGVGKAVGLDIDPCAISEAKQNIYLNQCTDKIMIFQQPLESFQKPFSIVLANLRFPTLANYHQHISDALGKDGISVFSGLKTEEIEPISSRYQEVKMIKQHTFKEKGWASIVFSKQEGIK